MAHFIIVAEKSEKLIRSENSEIAMQRIFETQQVHSKINHLFDASSLKGYKWMQHKHKCRKQNRKLKCGVVMAKCLRIPSWEPRFLTQPPASFHLRLQQKQMQWSSLIITSLTFMCWSHIDIGCVYSALNYQCLNTFRQGEDLHAAQPAKLPILHQSIKTLPQLKWC